MYVVGKQHNWIQIKFAFLYLSVTAKLFKLKIEVGGYDQLKFLKLQEVNDKYTQLMTEISCNTKFGCEPYKNIVFWPVRDLFGSQI